MEERDGVGDGSGGVTVVGSDAPSDYQLAPRTENPVRTTESPAAQPLHTGDAALPGMPFKKKRGRPRKYGPDGSVAMALSPRPISSSVPPPVIDFSVPQPKRGKSRGAGLVGKLKLETGGLGDWVACSVGANFTPHIITVNAGEYITMKVISFSQQGPRAICILSANGVISSVTLRQPDSSGGTLTYEGRFEILSLSGSFMPGESGGTRSRSGGMSVSLAGPDGRVVGGGVAGLLVAATPVQVIVGSFLAGDKHEQKTKKPKTDYFSTAALPSIIPISSSEPTISFTTSPAYRADSWPAIPSDSRSKIADINESEPKT